VGRLLPEKELSTRTMILGAITLIFAFLAFFGLYLVISTYVGPKDFGYNANNWIWGVVLLIIGIIGAITLIHRYFTDYSYSNL
jgi:hypothetical protein